MIDNLWITKVHVHLCLLYLHPEERQADRQLPNVSDRISFRLVVAKYMKCGSISVFAYLVRLTGLFLLLSVSNSLNFFVRYSLFVFLL